VISSLSYCWTAPGLGDGDENVGKAKVKVMDRIRPLFMGGRKTGGGLWEGSSEQSKDHESLGKKEVVVGELK